MAIEIENDVFDYVSSKIQEQFPKADVSSIEILAPSRFPHVSIIENDNRVFDRFRTTRVENAAVIMFEANVYSNKVTGKKEEAKAIANVMDEAFASIGFMRTLRYPVRNYSDPSIYRITSRYQGVAIPNDDGKIYIHSY